MGHHVKIFLKTDRSIPFFSVLPTGDLTAILKHNEHRQGIILEIRDPIHGALTVSRQEIQVLDSAVFQRLRMIKQLGFSEFSFPGATHSRYLHSLGAFYLAGLAFDSIFRDFKFSSEEKKHSYRQILRLGALLHDIGHGPLSHSTEVVMPPLKDLQIGVYKENRDHKAHHEDYTIKFITHSHLTKILSDSFPAFEPYHIACLIDRKLEDTSGFFFDRELNFRPILSQIISSEVDVDRMDYLVRDAYFCGISYGKVELNWLLGNFKYHIVEDRVHLALDRRAIYTFDDFLLSRHHMYLMVYFHHKSIIYEKMLYYYLTSENCDYKLPASIEDYTCCTDFSLYENMASSQNPWAQRITQHRPFRIVFEDHITSSSSSRTKKINTRLNEEGIETILANSRSHLSKYYKTGSEPLTIYALDAYSPPTSIDLCTEIFQKYEEARVIERVYVHPESMEKAKKILKSFCKEEFGSRSRKFVRSSG